MEEKIDRSICQFCHTNCGIIVRRGAGDTISVEGDPDHPMKPGALLPQVRRHTGSDPFRGSSQVSLKKNLKRSEEDFLGRGPLLCRGKTRGDSRPIWTLQPGPVRRGPGILPVPGRVSRVPGGLRFPQQDRCGQHLHGSPDDGLSCRYRRDAGRTRL